ncbi:SusD/RagB family nutrient-binding outer membrane lipoprotein [Aquimarina sp. 2201CG5-10]|uniref:SusD/RagB family nutrient-binding outer membrane lipoprotein n=1 Tax=Aquimarina callyspongiae TaxID=3098150 RepID=UPI002AB42B9C|nr:SusD/RagB family nutrient-binding outer membrane lipoprotein [Aquimarina sp. 2201CG5-10]MDY8134432.1 SusD/RagB family nutrient-binding outer membrane lipoprotein [Aquimarina sp. 2201CG5-10]
MKNKQFIRPIILFMLALVGFTSCETTELDLLQNPNDVTEENLDPEFLFNNIQLGFNGFVQTVAGDASFTSQVTRSFAMTGGNQYQNAFAPIGFNGIWSSAYAGILQDIKALEPVAQEQGLTYHLGASKIMRAYVLVTLVDLFGDVPYSEALQGNDNLNPMEDAQTDVYIAALNDIDEAITTLATETAVLPGDDMFFAKNNGGSVDADLQANWITAAKTLKLRILNNIRLNGSAVNINVTTEINTLLTENDLIDTPAEDWQFNYGNTRLNPNSRHPGYNRYYENGAAGYMSNYLMWTMIFEKGLDDPRLRYYFYRQDNNANGEDIFTLGCGDGRQSPPGHYASVTSIFNTTPVPFCTADPGRGYWGRDHGDNGGIPPDNQQRTVYGVYPAGGLFDENQDDDVQNDGEDGNLLGEGITPVLLTSYVNFIKAESALMSGTTGDARAFLEAGIRASIDKVVNFDAQIVGNALAPTTATIDAYVNFVLAAYDTADTNGRLDIIMKEYQIAAFGNGLEVYNGYRRTGFPSNYQPTLEPNSGDYYRSALYPANYVNVNVNATQKERTEQVFWDTNAAGFIN